MLGLFKTKCPIDADGKLWIEQRMCWLAEVFGLQRMVDADVVVPSREWFPARYTNSEDDIRNIFERVCGFLNLDPHRFQLRFHGAGDQESEEPLGTYESKRHGPETISVNLHEVQDPMSLVATIGHELSHALLIGERRILPGVSDHEWLTDLTTVFLGLGVFSANSAMRERQFSSDGRHYWRMSMRGYLNEIYYAYGLAVFAWVRKETKPLWASHLRANIRQSFQQSLRYLCKTDDCILQPEDFSGNFFQTRHQQSVAELVEDLRSNLPSSQLASLREMHRRGADLDSALDVVIQLLEDEDWSIREAAARLICTVGKEAAAAVPLLLHMLYERDPQARAFALETLGNLALDAPNVVSEVASLLDDSESHVRDQAAMTLGDFGEHSSDCVPRLMKELATLRDETVQAPAYAVSKIGQPAWSAIPQLVQIVQQGEGASRVHAAAALGGIGNRSEIVWETLHQAVFDNDHEVRIAALGALGKLKPVYADSIPVLRQALHHDDPDTRIAAASVISGVEGMAPAAVACLSNSLFPPLSAPADEHPAEFDESSYSATVRTLKDMAEEAIEPLLDLLEHPEDVTRRFALWAMGHIGSAAHPATERLQAELSNDDPAMVLLAAIALSNSGAPPVESIKSFLNVLTTHDLSQPLDPWFDVCELGLKARIAPTQLLDVLAETRQLHQAVIHFACREIGVTAVGALTEFGAGAEDQMANEIALILAAISHTAGNDAFDREAARADLGLATSRLLQRAREHRKQLTMDWHAFELAATSLPESVPHGVGEQSVNGQIRDATRLLIEGMTTSRLS